METTLWDEQEPALAETGNEVETVAPLPGLLTLIPPELVAAGVAAAVTVMATSVTQAEPPLPHDLTCTVCAPVAAGTCALTDAPLTMVVSGLLSSE